MGQPRFSKQLYCKNVSTIYKKPNAMSRVFSSSQKFYFKPARAHAALAGFPPARRFRAKPRQFPGPDLPAFRWRWPYRPQEFSGGAAFSPAIDPAMAPLRQRLQREDRPARRFQRCHSRRLLFSSAAGGLAVFLLLQNRRRSATRRSASAHFPIATMQLLPLARRWPIFHKPG